MSGDQSVAGRMTASAAQGPASRERLFEVLHEDGELLILQKPAGLVCHPTKQGEWSSLIGRVRLYLGAVAHLVNRLDRETSGVIVVAKNSEVAGQVGKIWEDCSQFAKFRLLLARETPKPPLPKRTGL